MDGAWCTDIPIYTEGPAGLGWVRVGVGGGDSVGNGAGLGLSILGHTIPQGDHYVSADVNRIYTHLYLTLPIKPAAIPLAFVSAAPVLVPAQRYKSRQYCYCCCYWYIL